MSLANDTAGTPTAISGQSGYVDGTTVGATPNLRDTGKDTNVGGRVYQAASVGYLWTPPYTYDLRDVGGYDGESAGPSSFVVTGFTVTADFPVVLYCAATTTRWGTPGLGRNGARMDIIATPPTPATYTFWIGGFARSTGDGTGPTGSFRLAWDYSPCPTIGSENETAGFFDPASRYEFVGRCVVPPLPQNFHSPPYKLYFSPIYTSGEPRQIASNWDAGEYLIVFAGGAYTIDQDGFSNEIPENRYVASPEDAVILSGGGGIADRVQAWLYWDDGASSEFLPLAHWDNTSSYPVLADVPKGPHFTRWSMRYYWKRITHTGGKIYVAARGCVGWSDPTGTFLGQAADGVLRFDCYSNDPKFFLYRVPS